MATDATEETATQKEDSAEKIVADETETEETLPKEQTASDESLEQESLSEETVSGEAEVKEKSEANELAVEIETEDEIIAPEGVIDGYDFYYGDTKLTKWADDNSTLNLFTISENDRSKRVLKFYLKDAGGNAVTSGNFEFYHGENGDLESNYQMSSPERNFFLAEKDQGTDIYEVVEFKSDGNGYYLQIDLSYILANEYPFPDTMWYDLWLDFGLKNTDNSNDDAWFCYKLHHDAVELNGKVFALGYDLSEGSSEQKAQELDGQVDYQTADWDNNFYLVGRKADDKGNLTLPVYIRTKADYAGTMEISPENDNEWIKTCSVSDKVGDCNGFTYYVVNLEMNTDDNVNHIGKFSVTFDDGKQNFSIYEGIPQYQIQEKNESQWPAEWKSWDWNEAVLMVEGDRIRFRMEGTAVSITKEYIANVQVVMQNEPGEGEDWFLVGYPWREVRPGEWDYVEFMNKSHVFKDSAADAFQISNTDARTALESRGWKYGENGNFQIFKYEESGNSETWYPTFTVTSQGMDAIEVCLVDGYGRGAAGNRLRVSNLPAFTFKQKADGAALTNWDNQHRPWDEHDPSGAVDGDNKLKLWLYEGENAVTATDDLYYELDEWASFEFYWRDFSYEGGRREENLTKPGIELKKDQQNRIYLEIDLNPAFDEFEREHPALRDKHYFDPLEFYDLYVHFGIHDAGADAKGLYLGYDYALRHEEEPADILLFGLDDYDNFWGAREDGEWQGWRDSLGTGIGVADFWDDEAETLKEAYLAGAWHYKLTSDVENVGTSQATWGGYIGESANNDSDEILFYIRMHKEQNPSHSRNFLNVSCERGELVGSPKVAFLGDVTDNDVVYSYYSVRMPRVFLENLANQKTMKKRLNLRDNPVAVTVTAGDSSRTFTLTAAALQYSVKAAGKETFGEWQEYAHDGSQIYVNAGDQIRFRADGTAACSVTGMIGDIGRVYRGSKTNGVYRGVLEAESLDPTSDEAKALKELYDININDYNDIWDNEKASNREPTDPIRYENGNRYIFVYGNEGEIYYPVYTAADGKGGIAGVWVNVNDPFGMGFCGAGAEVANEPKFALRQEGALANLAEGDSGYELNTLKLPEDGVLKFALYSNGEPVTTADYPELIPIEEWGNAFELYAGAFGDDCRRMNAELKTNSDKWYIDVNLNGNGNDFIWGDGFWMQDGFDFWIHAAISEKDNADSRWQLDVGTHYNPVGLRLKGNEGTEFKEDETDDSRRFNLRDDGENILMPPEDGILRVYLYQENNVYGENGIYTSYKPMTDANPYAMFGVPEVNLVFNKFDGKLQRGVGLSWFDDNTNSLSVLKDEKDIDRVAFKQDGDRNGQWYLEVNLNGIKHQFDYSDPNEKEVTLDLLKDYYRLEVRFAKRNDQKEVYAEKCYHMIYSPVTVLGWNDTNNLSGHELARLMTLPWPDRINPGEMYYLDEQLGYRGDGTVVMYLRVPKNLAPEGRELKGTDFVTLTKSNLWIGADKDVKENWFTRITSVMRLEENEWCEPARWTEYPVDEDAYCYYQVRVKGATKDGMTRGSITVKLTNGESYDFTLEAAKMQYSKVLTPEEEDWIDEEGSLVLAPGEEVRIRLKTAVPRKGVYAVAVDYDPENTAFTINADDMPGGEALAYWEEHYAEVYDRHYFGGYYEFPDDKPGNVGGTCVNDKQLTPVMESDGQGNEWEKWVDGFQQFSYMDGNDEKFAYYIPGYVDENKYFIFTYEDGTETKIFSPKLKSDDSEHAQKEIAIEGVLADVVKDAQGKEVLQNTRGWITGGTFECVKENFTLRRADNRDVDLEENDAAFSTDGEELRFYIYKNGKPFVVDAEEEFGFSDEDWYQAAVWYGGMESNWAPDETMRLDRDAKDGCLYVALSTDRLKDEDGNDKYAFADYIYTMGFRLPIWIGDEDSWVVIEAVQVYCPTENLGAKLILEEGTKEVEDEDGEIVKKPYQIFQFVKNGGKTSIALSQEKVKLEIENFSLGDMDMEKPFSVVSSNENVVKVVRQIQYAGEDQWTNSVLDKAELELKELGNSDITIKFFDCDGEEHVITFNLTVKRGEVKSLEGVTVELAKEGTDTEYKYIGEAIKPRVVVKDGNDVLVENIDYTLTYTNNVKPGTAKISITGQGDYKDTIVKEYKIYGTLTYQFAEGVDKTPDGKDLPTIAAEKFYDTGLAKLAEGDKIEGYKLLWYSDAKATKEVTGVPAGTSENLTYYGKWSKAYAVTFEVDGGSAVEAQSVVEGGTVTKPADPTKTDFTFGGWYKEAACTTAWDFEKDTVTADTKIYAKWTENIKKYTVTFNTNGAPAIETQVIVDGKTAVEPAAPALSGYKFGGWFTDANCTRKYDFAAAVTADVTLYAKWLDASGLKIYFLDEEGETADSYTATYTGNAIKPELLVIYNGETLAASEYSLTYANNVKAGDANNGNGPSVTVKGKGRFTGSYKMGFTIQPVSLDTLKYVEEMKVVAGKKATPIITFNGAMLKSGDYSVAYGSDEMTVTGKGNFTGEITIAVETIEKSEQKNLKSFTVSLSQTKFTYDGTVQVPEVTVKDKKDKSADMSEGSDYMIFASEDAIDVGKYSVTVVGIGDYIGSVTKTYNITPLKLTDARAVYSGTVYYNPKGATLEDLLEVRGNNTALKEGVDYTVKYSNNKKAGTGKYTVTFKGNYKGTKALKGTYSIERALLTEDEIGVLAADKVGYTKPGEYKVKPAVTLNGTLLKASDYTVEYYMDEACTMKMDKKNNPVTIDTANDEKYATVYLRLTGKGSFDGSVICGSYRVYLKKSGLTDLSKAKVKLSENSMSYTGEELKPGISSVTAGGSSVSSDAYEVIYFNNVNPGTAKVMIKAKEGSDYCGSKIVTFKVKSSSIANLIK